MKIQTKLTIGACSLITFALVLTSLAISITAGKESSATLEKLTYKELLSVKELTGQAVSDYFDEIKGLVQVTSADPRVIEATQEFRQHFPNYHSTASHLPDKATQQAAVGNYYSNEYGQEYQRINNRQVDTQRLINQLSDEALALQYDFIAKNQHPLGNKELLSALEADNAYNRTHAEFHPHTRNVLYHFGFYDIFIADIDTGNIIYSVYKELDYGTSLLDGAYANTGIGEAFKKAAAANDPENTHLTGFNTYQPSYSAPASFISSPIYDGAEKIGVLIFQVPMDKINNIMTHHEEWEKAALGLTGETVLVGKDKKARSNSRQLIEDREGFIELLTTKKLASSEDIARINQLENNLGIQTIDNEAVDRALAGEKGTMHYIKYTGNEVLVAYGTIKVLNQEWVILSEMDLNEALQETELLLEKINLTAIITAIVGIMVCVSATMIFTKVLLKPLQNMIVLVGDLATGDGNLCKRLKNNSNDETGELSRFINQFIDKIQTLVSNINDEAKSLKTIASTMENIADDNLNGAKQQQETSQQVDNSMKEMSLAANESAQSASSAERAAAEVLTATNEGTAVMNLTADSIQTVASNVEEAVAIIKELETTSETIGSVVGVINGIAEQTNLLALNAAIEAARAGEQGRGFAVVADEVRALASRTQESTLEINSIIEKLQQNANTAVNVMSTGHEAVNRCVEEAEKAQASLQAIELQISDINAMNLRIATSAEEQSAVSDTVTENVAEITDISNRNAEGASMAINKTKEMSTSITSLNNSIAQFSVDECDVNLNS